MRGLGQRISEDGHTHDTRAHVSVYARRGVAMLLGGARLRSRHDTSRRAPVPAPAPLGTTARNSAICRGFRYPGDLRPKGRVDWHVARLFRLKAACAGLAG